MSTQERKTPASGHRQGGGKRTQSQAQTATQAAASQAVHSFGDLPSVRKPAPSSPAIAPPALEQEQTAPPLTLEQINRATLAALKANAAELDARDEQARAERQAAAPGRKARPAAALQAEELIRRSAELDASQNEPAQEEAQTLTKQFTGVTASIIKKRPPMTWRIKYLLPAQGKAMLFGHSNTGKSLCLIDMAARIALGIPWHGKKTTPTAVHYFYLEGASGLGKRIPAWEEKTGLTYPEDVIFYDQDALDVINDAPAIAAAMQPGNVCIIDTLMQSAPGRDVSSNADMSYWLNTIKQEIVLPRQSLVIFAHHTLKGNTTAHLGAGCLYNDPDAVLKLEANSGVVTLTDTKQRDEAKGKRYSFRIETVDQGVDEDGDAITSAAVVPCETPDTPGDRRPKLSAGEEVAYQVLIDLTGSGTKPGPESVPLDYWREAYNAASTKDPGTKRKAFSRAREGLVQKGYVSVFNDVYKVISDDYT